MKTHLHFSLDFLLSLIALLAFGFAMVRNPSVFFASSLSVFSSEILLVTTVGTLFKQQDK